MNLKELQKNWHKFGEIAPLETIFCPRGRRGKKWDTEEFFTSGEREIETLIEYVKSLNLEFPRGTALDFGCGVGRTTQPLARYFDVCYGVDIASSMIELANKFNRYGDKCRYVLNETYDLKLFPDNSFNFIYSMITFQNMAPRYSKKYIKEFMRILTPGGLLIFQIPSESKTFRMALKQKLPPVLLALFYKLKYRGRPRLELHGVKREEVIKLLEENGGQVIDIKPDQRAFSEWSSFQYCVVKEKR